MESQLIQRFLKHEKFSSTSLSELLAKSIPANSLISLLNQDILRSISPTQTKNNSKKKKVNKRLREVLPANEYMIPSAIFKLDLLMSIHIISESQSLSGNLKTEMSKLKNQIKKVFKQTFYALGEFNSEELLFRKQLIILYFDYIIKFLGMCFSIFNNLSILSDLLAYVLIFLNQIIQNEKTLEIFFHSVQSLIRKIIVSVLKPNNELQIWIHSLISELDANFNHFYLIENEKNLLEVQNNFKVIILMYTSNFTNILKINLDIIIHIFIIFK